MVAQITAAGSSRNALISENRKNDLEGAPRKPLGLAPIFAPAAMEDLLTGGRSLRASFADAPSHTASRGTIVISPSTSAPPVLQIQRGVAFSSYTLPDGRRAIVDVFLPMDFIGIEHVVVAEPPA